MIQSVVVFGDWRDAVVLSTPARRGLTTPIRCDTFLLHAAERLERSEVCQPKREAVVGQRPEEEARYSGSLASDTGADSKEVVVVVVVVVIVDVAASIRPYSRSGG